jgi:stage IV sporulation protein FB
MEESAPPLPEPDQPEQLLSPEQEEASNAVPPKWETQQNPSNIWLRSFLSLAAYLVIGNYIFPSYRILLLITAILIIHELGHFIAMKLFRYKDLGIFFIPLLGAYVSGSKREVSQTQSAIILLAGPLPGIVFGIILFLLFKQNPLLEFAGISYYTISISFLFLNLINLIPVYPLDGGQLLNRVFLDEESWVSKGFILLSIAALCWIALFAFKTPSYPLLLFPALMILRLFGEKKMTAIEKRIEVEGINTDLDYADLPDEDYWKIRNILIEEHAGFKDIDPAPPYTYSPKEDRVMQMIKGLLHRHLIQDMSLLGKLLTIVIWLAAFAAPWFLGIYEIILRRLGY